MSFCLNILNDEGEMNQINAFNIVLILKIPHPKKMVNFRPISLCNVLYIIIAKTLANRLQEVLELCIDKAQNAFAPGQLISDNVLIAYELFHTFR